MFKSSNFSAICDQLKAAKEFLFKNFDLNEGFENEIENNKKKCADSAKLFLTNRFYVNSL